jgi:hypothetical protein
MRSHFDKIYNFTFISYNNLAHFQKLLGRHDNQRDGRGEGGLVRIE